MRRRYLASGLLACAMLLLLGSFPGEGVAQDLTASYSVGQPAGLHEVAMLFKKTPVAVRLYEVSGPDSIHVGQEGRFTAVANVETASLPLHVQWDFGDGTTANSLHTRHRFSTPGTYSVVFRLSNRYGTAVDTLVVTVVPAEVVPPSASLEDEVERNTSATSHAAFTARKVRR